MFSSMMIQHPAAPVRHRIATAFPAARLVTMAFVLVVAVLAARVDAQTHEKPAALPRLKPVTPRLPRRNTPRPQDRSMPRPARKNTGVSGRRLPSCSTSRSWSGCSSTTSRRPQQPTWRDAARRSVKRS